jgi:hypothetical protein
VFPLERRGWDQIKKIKIEHYDTSVVRRYIVARVQQKRVLLFLFCIYYVLLQKINMGIFW